MKYVDLSVMIERQEDVGPYVTMANTLGFSALAVRGLDPKWSDEHSEVSLYSRVDLQPRHLNSLKKEIGKLRRSFTVIAMPLGGVEIANWAAEDTMVDLLTIGSDDKSRLRKTTAGLAADNGTALEISVRPLLESRGLDRSKVIKMMKENLQIAVRSGMDIVLSSNAHAPICMRSPRAMYHVAVALGLEQSIARAAVQRIPAAIIERNVERLRKTQILPGLKIVGDEE
jgi:ribonuclease P/MRP protein subunit RPP1